MKPPRPEVPTDPADRVPAADPFVRRVAFAVGLIGIAALFATLVVLGIEILLAAFAGVLFAVFLRALTTFATRTTRLSDGWAFACVLLLLVALFAGAGSLLAPQVATQVEELNEQMPQIVAEVEEFLQNRSWGRWILDRAQGDELPGELAGALPPLVSGFLGWLTIGVTIFFVGVFAAANPGLYQDATVHLVPLRHRPLVREVLGELGYTLRWWLIGRAIAMLMVGITTTLVLLLLGLPFALLLGILAGLLTFVPYLGPIAAGVPIVLFSLLEGPQTALWVLLAYTAIQNVEGMVLDPIIMHKLIYIPPVMTIVLQVLMGVAVGVMGVVVATPFAAVLVVLNRFYRREVLGDPLVASDAGHAE